VDRAGSLITAGGWIAKGIAGAVPPFWSFRNRPAQTVQLRFIHLPAAFITLPAAFIPFSFSMVGGVYRVPHLSGGRLYRLSR
jgi:hypothetical protein